MKHFIFTILLAIAALSVQAQQSNTAILRGRVVNFGYLAKDGLEIDYTNPLQIMSHNSIPLLTDSLGRFEVEIPLMNTTPVHLWDITMLLTPGETYDLELSFAAIEIDKMEIKGRNEQLINEIIKHPPVEFKWDFDAVEEMSDVAVIEYAEKKLQSLTAINDSIMKANPGLSQQWYDYAQLVNINKIANRLVQRRFTDPMVRQSSDGKLWQWLHDRFLSNLPRPMSLGQDLGYFMLNYVKEILAPRGRKGLNLRGINTAINIALEQQADGTLKRDNAFAQKLKNIQSMLDEFKTLVESGAPDSVLAAHPFAINVNETFADPYLNGLFKGPVSERETIEDISRLGTLDLPDDLRDYARAVLLYNEIETFHAPLRPDLQKLVPSVENEFFRKTINERNIFYRAIALRNIKGLMPNEPLANLTDGKEIFEKIIAPYRGRILYVDFWGTWCGPCKIDLKTCTQPLHNALADLPVTYLYLCNGSTVEAWRSTIVEYNLSAEHSIHYNLPAAQQKAVEDYLQVRHFPTYIIFDRDGKRVTTPDNEPAPVNPNLVRKVMEGL